MQSTPNPNQTDPDDVLVIAPDIVLVARADRADKAHDAINLPSDSQTHVAPDFSAGPSVLPVDTTFRAAAVNDVQVRGDRRSIGGRAIRACIGFLLAVCIAVAASLWQSYGDAAKQIVARWVPQFALTSSSPQDNPGLPGNRARLPSKRPRRRLYLRLRRPRKASHRPAPPCLLNPRSRSSRWRAISHTQSRRSSSSRPASRSSRPASNKCPATLPRFPKPGFPKPRLPRPGLPTPRFPSRTCDPGYQRRCGGRPRRRRASRCRRLRPRRKPLRLPRYRKPRLSRRPNWRRGRRCPCASSVHPNLEKFAHRP